MKILLALATGLGLASSALFAAGTTQPAQQNSVFIELGIPAPPALAKDGRYMTNTETGTFQGDIKSVRAFMDQNPITDFVTPTDAIPAITGFDYLSGSWPDPGAVRRANLADGTSVLETVIENTPTRFAYQIWNIQSSAKLAVNHIKGEFTYAQNGENVTVTWDYNVKPTVFLTRPLVSRFLKNDFGPFMAAGMTGLEKAHATK